MVDNLIVFVNIIRLRLVDKTGDKIWFHNSLFIMCADKQTPLHVGHRVSMPENLAAAREWIYPVYIPNLDPKITFHHTIHGFGTRPPSSDLGGSYLHTSTPLLAFGMTCCCRKNGPLPRPCWVNHGAQSPWPPPFHPSWRWLSPCCDATLFPHISEPAAWSSRCHIPARPSSISWCQSTLSHKLGQSWLSSETNDGIKMTTDKGI